MNGPSNMLISNSRKFIYIHLHKCAGTSIESALSTSLKWNDVLLGSTPEGEKLQYIYKHMFGLYKHSTADIVRNTIGAELWDAYYSFSTVRNPYALAASQYTYSMQHMRAGLRQFLKLRPKDDKRPLRVPLNEWPWSYPGVQALLTQRGEQTSFSEFIRSPRLLGWNGFATMKSQLCDTDGNLLVKDVFRLEDLSACWPGICRTLGLDGLALGSINSSKGERGNYRDFYRGDDDVAFIRDRFKEDFLFFGYPECLRDRVGHPHAISTSVTAQDAPGTRAPDAS